MVQGAEPEGFPHALGRATKWCHGATLPLISVDIFTVVKRRNGLPPVPRTPYSWPSRGRGSCSKLPAANGPDPFRAAGRRDGPTPASSVGPGRYRPAPLPCLLRDNHLQGFAPRESDHRNPGSSPWLTRKASFQEDVFCNGTVLKASRVIALCAILSCEGPSCCQYFTNRLTTTAGLHSGPRATSR